MTSRTLLLAAAAVLSLGFAAQAQESLRPGSPPSEDRPPTAMPPATTPPVNTPDPSAAPPRDMARPAEAASVPSSTSERSWIGAAVVDSKGAKVGKIEKLVKDAEGAVTAAQIRVGGKLVVVPTSTLTLNGSEAVSTQTRTEIEATPR